MTLRTRLGSAAAATVFVMFLAACAPTPSAPGDALAGTTWSGTDSRDAEWEFEFHEDRTIGFSYKGSEFDDPSDTWSVAGGELRISLEFADGTATMVGPYENGAESVDLDGQQEGQTGSWTLTITE